MFTKLLLKSRRSRSLDRPTLSRSHALALPPLHTRGLFLLAVLTFTAFSLHAQTQQQLDFGDAPQQYPTLLANNGARHVITPGFFLGSLIDAEPDGQPNATATGDDNNPATADDEDGVQFTSPLIPGQTATVQVTTTMPSGTTGFLDAWIDFNANGSWADPGD